MSAKMMSSLTGDNRDTRKQIGCMNIFHLFDRHHFLTGRRLSSHNHKRLLLGPQHQLEPHNATKAIIEKDLELQKEKPRVSVKSSQSSDSSTFSSHEYNKTNFSESPCHSLTNNLQSPHIRDVVKDSMQREARGLSIKSRVNDVRKVTVMKHIDSPRPLQQPQTTVHEGSPRGFCKVQEGTKRSSNERMTLPRYSYDGRELRDTFRTTMKIKELPRFSLDSKTSSMKCSDLESRSNLRNKNSSQVVSLNQEHGSHSRSNSIVAKLMGLDDFPDIVSTDEVTITKIKSSPSPSPRTAISSPISQKNPTSSSPRMYDANSVRKPTTCTRLPMELAPWKQRDPQGSPKTAAQKKKAPTNNTPHSSSVYGEIERRLTELEFKSSGKDLRALKQILEAMKKTRERMENQIEESAEVTLQKSCPNPNPNLLMWQNRKTYQQVQTVTGTSNGIMKPAKVMEKVKTSSSDQVVTMETPYLQRIKVRESRYHTENQARRGKAKDITPGNNMKEPNQRVPYEDRRISWRNLEVERTLRATRRVENCTTSGRRLGPVSPRLQQNILRIEGESRHTNSSPDSSTVKKHSHKHVREKCPRNRKHNVKSMDLRLSDDQLSDLSSEARQSSYQSDAASIKSESNNNAASHIETEIISSAKSVKTKSRQQQDFITTSKEHVSEVEHAVTMTEQPSPVSVLDATFYSEDSPSPIKKKSTAFKDESPSPDEAEWHLENLNQSTDCTKSDPGYKHNERLEKMLHVHELRLLKTEQNETAANQNESVYRSSNPDHKYITRILLASGLLEDTNIIPTADQLLSSCHLMNPNMFHALEEMEDSTDEANEEPIKKNNQKNLNQKIQRKLVFDTVNEVMVRKITSSGLFIWGRKRMSPQRLMKEVYAEMDHLCRMPCHNLDYDDDRLDGLLTADKKYQADDWTDYRGEFPSLVLDIERLIFKDLINEIVTREVVASHDWPKRQCRQLFT
ncbi:hypothetical protein CDL12_29650 [Handroanthus impetiginosus]|uniref:DUF4378 domain-containing protein n=1 Tax=Handroanthus impetiginosus TaxID=429701 RepID=A0A2G9FXU1_9LAMI|nr:hypothetical protein CDL12_29650 [Handroanthus impetiginosus]